MINICHRQIHDPLTRLRLQGLPPAAHHVTPAQPRSSCRVIRPFEVQFGGESPDSQAGGHTKAGLVTDKRLKISYHGARTVTGGTPFRLQ